MGLATYKPRTTEVSIGDENTVPVRGLSFNDVVQLFDKHSTEINKALDLMDENAGKEDPATDEAMLTHLMALFPDLVASIITAACDETGSESVAKRLPFPTQLELVLATVEMTFQEVGGPKKFMGMVGTVLAALGKNGKIQLPQRLNTGS